MNKIIAGLLIIIPAILMLVFLVGCPPARCHPIVGWWILGFGAIGLGMYGFKKDEKLE